MSDSLPKGWTMFPPLPLRDSGTDFVESLEGYAHRLFFILGQRPLSMLRFMDQQAETPTIHNSKIRAGLNGPGTLFLQRMKVLEYLTSIPLRGSTFWTLNNVLRARSGGLSGTSRRWCPACLKGAVNPVTDVTDRLIWNFSHYSRCSIHGVDIENSCSKCGLQQCYGRAAPNRSVCHHCNAPLFHDGSRGKRADVLDWTDKILEEYIQWSSSGDAIQIPQDNYALYVSLIIQNQRISELKRRCPILYYELIRFRRRQTSVRMLLNLAALHGVSLLDILLRPKEAASAPLFDRYSDFESVPFPPTSITAESSRMNALVETLFNKEHLLPPCRLLCKQFAITLEDYARFFEANCARYRETVSMQRKLYPVSGHALSRTFCATLHLLASQPDLATKTAKRLASMVADLIKPTLPKTVLEPVARTCLRIAAALPDN